MCNIELRILLVPTFARSREELDADWRGGGGARVPGGGPEDACEAEAARGLGRGVLV